MSGFGGVCRVGGAWAALSPEFEGLDMGEFSGGMDSCLRRNDGMGGFLGWGAVGERDALDSSRGIGMGRRGGGGVAGTSMVMGLG